MSPHDGMSMMNPNSQGQDKMPEVSSQEMLERILPAPLELERSRSRLFQDAFFESELDEEWSSPLTKVSTLLDGDYESWKYAKELLEAPTAHCRKVGDEARSLAARYIIDRLREKNLLNKIDLEAPRLRSAVELLSKPDADYVYPPFQFVANHIRFKYPEIYESVVKNVGLSIPDDLKPSAMLVTLAKQMLENSDGEVDLSWGKFVSLLALCGALAIDSVEADYPEGVTQVVETFGVLTEQIMGEWIVSEKDGGGWEGFIRLNIYQAILPPLPRTFIILFLGLLLFYFFVRLVAHFYFVFFWEPPSITDSYFWIKWANSFYSFGFCTLNGDQFNFTSQFFPAPTYSIKSTCPNPTNPLEYLILSKFLSLPNIALFL